MKLFHQLIIIAVLAFICFAAMYGAKPPTNKTQYDDVYSNLNVTEDDLINFVYEE